VQPVGRYRRAIDPHVAPLVLIAGPQIWVGVPTPRRSRYCGSARSSWVFRFVLRRKAREMGLDSFNTITDARCEA
jgi:hypothetical protein